jgi:hypothetical protein
MWRPWMDARNFRAFKTRQNKTAYYLEITGAPLDFNFIHYYDTP